MLPNQINVGDSLIFGLVAVALFRALGLTVRYVSDLLSYEPESLRQLMPRGVILIHGGESSDIWEATRGTVSEWCAIFQITRLSNFHSPFSLDREGAQLKRTEFSVSTLTFTSWRATRSSIERAAADVPDVRVSCCHDMALGWDAPVARTLDGRLRGFSSSREPT